MVVGIDAGEPGEEEARLAWAGVHGGGGRHVMGRRIRDRRGAQAARRELGPRAIARSGR